MSLGRKQGEIVLTMLGKVGTSVSDLDELKKRSVSERAKTYHRRVLTPVPLSTTKGAEGSMLSSDRVIVLISSRKLCWSDWQRLARSVVTGVSNGQPPSAPESMIMVRHPGSLPHYLLPRAHI
jgi:hypothetical protein